MSDAPTNRTVLGPDCRISGELALDNDAVIMGHFKGTLRVSGQLELAESAEVAGTIIVGTLRLSGNVEADVVAEDGVELLAGAQLIGQVFTSRLNIAEGAVFQGEICVGPKAMEAASEAFSQGEQQADPASVISHESEQADEAGQSPVRTNASSVNAVLQRRRPKVLSPRNGGGVGTKQ